MKVIPMKGRTGKSVVNQYIIKTGKGSYFQSYDTHIAFVSNKGKVTLDKIYWDYSVTTSKYLNIFLNSTSLRTKQAIKDGTYKLRDLNKA